MSTPKQVPAKQKRFLQENGTFINLGKKESDLMTDMCRFFKFGNGVICLDQAKQKIHLLTKNEDNLFIKKQTIQLKSKKIKKEEPIEKYAEKIVNRIKSRKMTETEKEEFFFFER